MIIDVDHFHCIHENLGLAFFSIPCNNNKVPLAVVDVIQREWCSVNDESECQVHLLVVDAQDLAHFGASIALTVWKYKREREMLYDVKVKDGFLTL